MSYTLERKNYNQEISREMREVFEKVAKIPPPKKELSASEKRIIESTFRE